jgi:hypothetical protein
MTNDTEDGIKQPDLGPEAIQGFQSQVYPAERPFARANYTVKTVEGRGFQTATRQEPGVHPQHHPQTEQ